MLLGTIAEPPSLFDDERRAAGLELRPHDATEKSDQEEALYHFGLPEQHRPVLDAGRAAE